MGAWARIVLLNAPAMKTSRFSLAVLSVMRISLLIMPPFVSQL
jgi:hypothetical protein